MPNCSADYSFLLIINPLTCSVFSLSRHNSRTTCRELRGNQGEWGRKSCQWEILVWFHWTWKCHACLLQHGSLQYEHGRRVVNRLMPRENNGCWVGYVNFSNFIKPNRPYYSYELSNLASEWTWGCGWPCFDTNLSPFLWKSVLKILVSIRITGIKIIKQEGLYQNKVNSSLVCSRNCTRPIPEASAHFCRLFETSFSPGATASKAKNAEYWILFWQLTE